MSLYNHIHCITDHWLYQVVVLLSVAAATLYGSLFSCLIHRRRLQHHQNVQKLLMFIRKSTVMKNELNKNLQKHPVVSRIPIGYAFQAGYLAFGARQWAVIIPSYQFAMVPNKPPCLQNWNRSRQPKYKVLFSQPVPMFLNKSLSKIRKS